MKLEERFIGANVLATGMSDVETISRIFRSPSPLSTEVMAPAKRSYISGVLVITGPSSRFSVNRLQYPVRKRGDVRVDSLIEACRQLLTQRFDLVIVLPDATSVSDEMTLATLRDLASGSPILVLSETAASVGEITQSGEWQRELAGLEHVGADLMRCQTVTVGPIIGHRASGMITANGSPLNLSPSQSRILWRLLEAPQNQCKMAELVGAMDNPGLDNAMDTLRVHISRLRSKLAQAGCDRILATGRGVYWLHWPKTA